MTDQLTNKHIDHFQQVPLIVRSPGRINLMGGHTDYNKGFALPAAIDKAIYLSFSKTKNNATTNSTITVVSVDFDETVKFDLNNLPENASSWKAYLVAMLEELKNRKYAINGFDCMIQGDIPFGAGLSSSAAFCCGLAYGLSNLFDLKISKRDIALIAQATEHRIGLNCGLLDQFAIVFSQSNRGLFVDFKTLEIEDCPMNLEDCVFVLFDSKVKHELAAEGGYNERVKSCQNVVNVLKQNEENIESLRDVSMELLEAKKNHIDPTDYKRAKYIIGENERVKLAKLALEAKQAKQLGALMTETHRGLQNDYEVTTPELDYLIDLVEEHPHFYGGRMIGGGFGGCTLNLLQKDKAQKAIADVKDQYFKKFKIDIPAYLVNPSAGLATV